MGLDFGDRRIGVALSDPEGILASPLTIINYEDEEVAIQGIINIIAREQVGQIIVGLPRYMDGNLSKQAEKVKDFTERLRSRTDVPIEFRDERLTTVSARRLMQDAHVRKKIKKGGDDAVAAAIILQSYLDEHREWEDISPGQVNE